MKHFIRVYITIYDFEAGFYRVYTLFILMSSDREGL